MYIGHAGAGSFKTNLNASCPAIYIPIVQDQFIWAKVGEENGISMICNDK